ncbi:MAG: hypothetical protein HOE11_01455 [Candidatus Diapherotrites archaeon]|jgi:hypothetical protein|nr:hypothetical protein [Candidatus Diapherotrites archaeon]MBT4596387.1 hypothetical protein [Candidatus Diapherotrites archaeon]
MQRKKGPFETHLGQQVVETKRTMTIKLKALQKMRNIFGQQHSAATTAERELKRAQTNFHEAKWKHLQLKHGLEKDPKIRKQLVVQMTTAESNFAHIKEDIEKLVAKEKNKTIRELDREVDILDKEREGLQEELIGIEGENYLPPERGLKLLLRVAEINLKISKKAIEIAKILGHSETRIKTHQTDMRLCIEHIKKVKRAIERLG